MIITTEKPERTEALIVIKQAVRAGAYEWPAGESFTSLAKQLAAHLHTTISANEIEAIIDAYNDYVGRLDWNQEEILDYLDETRWHPELEDAAWDRTLEVLRETTNVILLAMRHDILDDIEAAHLYTGNNPIELRSAA